MHTRHDPNHDPRRQAHVFCDLSNIYVSLQNLYSENRQALRLHVGNLNELLIGSGRNAVLPPLWVTSDSVDGRAESLKKHTDKSGVNLVIKPRQNGREVDVDDYLLNAIHERLVTKEPAVLVVATGDGAGFYQHKGFLYACRRARDLGWAVEVLAWKTTCHEKLRVFAELENGFTDLGRHFASITFVVGGRSARPVSWTRRATAEFPSPQLAA